jgi:uncharacterized protein YcbK (DUF882 family)
MVDEVNTFAGPNFTRHELECKCGCGAVPSSVLMMKLRELRERLGKPILITSAMRCPEHNERVAHTGENGPHTTGLAVDIACDGKTAFDIIGIAIELDVCGIGVSLHGASKFLHLDWCGAPLPRPMVWSY